MIKAIARILRVPDLLPRLVGEWALIRKCQRVYQSCKSRAMAGMQNPIFNRKLKENILTKFLKHPTMATYEVLLNSKQLS